ncbi:metallo-phosphoesterase [Mycobacterium phage CicholasNage]|uniref:Esterase n=1 Tax=Mycobacterium phage CicholasNage TaxID=2500799 RepID=A0A411BPL9_9CAUD|nr:metallo-phosphoesterase [Mycobacterium phage CicholasNage]AZS12200.1 esterase [Mycobacterium phage Acquire49]QGJ92450.1 esterase [Mycobacterium phage Wyatt2]QGJ93065.1 esterase [Mycobacterium phage Zaria]QWT30573.1 esterase [Mycobacterium phage Rose5]WMI34639.1 esterase [Mycobacterium phage Calm]
MDKDWLFSGGGAPKPYLTIDELIHGVYRDDQWREDWLNSNARLVAGPPTPKNGSSTFTATHPKKVPSPTVGAGLSERRGVMPDTTHETHKLGLRQPKKLMMAGDWHGNLPWAFKAINYAKANGADTIVHVGDFGWWSPGLSTNKYLEEVNRELEFANIDLLWVDGNHEHHAFWNQFNKPDSLPLTLNCYKRITHLPRGYRWEWWGETWMALGGAYSIDRSFGRQGETWWHGETLDGAQFDYARRPGKVDIIVAHDAPAGVKIPGIDPDKPVYLKINGTVRRVPSADLVQAQAHRQWIQDIVDAVKPVEFYHGHYHKAYQVLCRHEGGGYTLVTGLDKDGTTMEKNTRFIDGPAREEFPDEG